MTANTAPLGSANGNTGFAFGQMPSDSSVAPPFNLTAGASFNFGGTPTGTIQFG